MKRTDLPMIKRLYDISDRDSQYNRGTLSNQRMLKVGHSEADIVVLNQRNGSSVLGCSFPAEWRSVDKRLDASYCAISHLRLVDVNDVTTKSTHCISKIMTFEHTLPKNSFVDFISSRIIPANTTITTPAIHLRHILNKAETKS